MIEKSPTIFTYRPVLEWRPERAEYRFHLLRESREEGNQYLQLVAEKISRHGLIPPDKSLPLDVNEAEQFMLAFAQEARKCGIRPPIDAEETAAIRRHLEDMRALAFATSKAEKP